METKKFGNKVYYYHGFRKFMREAKVCTINLRAKGYNARISPSERGWYIWKRKKLEKGGN